LTKDQAAYDPRILPRFLTPFGKNKVLFAHKEVAMEEPKRSCDFFVIDTQETAGRGVVAKGGYVPLGIAPPGLTKFAPGFVRRYAGVRICQMLSLQRGLTVELRR